MKKRTFWILVLTTGLFLLPLLSFFHAGFPVTHDGQDHVARIANFYESLSEGNIVPRWAGQLNWGYGHPILMFLYPLPSYAASLIHFFGLSLVDSTKVVFAASYVLSVLTMYIWIKKQWGIYPAFFAALSYGFAPYRFVDLYVRGAIGEHMAFIFPPLLCLGLLMRARREHARLSALVLALGTAGLVLSHNALSLMFLPIVFLYGVYLFFFEARDNIKYALFSFLFIGQGFLISTFFWMPAFFEGKYTLRDIVTKGDFTNRFVPWAWFLYSPSFFGGRNEFTKEVGILNWLGIVSCLVLLFKNIAKKTRWLLVGSLVLFVLTLLFMTQVSQPVWAKITILQKFQFPWRLLSASVFISSFILAVVATQIPKKFTRYIMIVFLIIVTTTTHQMWAPKSYEIKPDSFYTGIYHGTTDTGESSPIWSVRFMEKTPAAQYEIAQGQGTITPVTRNSTTHIFTVNAVTRVRVVENTLYFPGWQVTVDGTKLLEDHELIYQDPSHRGLMTFWVSQGRHNVVTSFGDTKLRKTASLISIIGLLSLAITISIKTL